MQINGKNETISDSEVRDRIKENLKAIGASIEALPADACVSILIRDKNNGDNADVEMLSCGTRLHMAHAIYALLSALISDGQEGDKAVAALELCRLIISTAAGIGDDKHRPPEGGLPVFGKTTLN